MTTKSNVKTVTKKDLIDRITDATKLRRPAVKSVVQLFLDQIVVELSSGHRLEFRDFGVFEIKHRAARIAQNPKTLEKVTVPAHRTVKFKVGRLMRDGLDSKPTDDGHTPQVEVKAKAPKQPKAGARG